MRKSISRNEAKGDFWLRIWTTMVEVGLVAFILAVCAMISTVLA